MLDRVGDVGGDALEAGRGQRPLEHATGGPDKRLALDAFGIAGLLAHQHQACARRSLAEDRLRRPLPQIAAAARASLASRKIQTPLT